MFILASDELLYLMLLYTDIPTSINSTCAPFGNLMLGPSFHVIWLSRTPKNVPVVLLVELLQLVVLTTRDGVFLLIHLLVLWTWCVLALHYTALCALGSQNAWL